MKNPLRELVMLAQGLVLTWAERLKVEAGIKL